MQTTQPWPLADLAARFFEDQFSAFAAQNPKVAQLAERFAEHGGVNLLTLIDHWVLPASVDLERRLADCDLTRTTTEDGDPVWEHPKARLPRVLLVTGLDKPQIAIAVEEPALFAEANGFAGAPAGDADSAYESISCALPQGTLAAVARRGYRDFRAGTLGQEERVALSEVRKAFREREREGEEAAVMRRAHDLAKWCIGKLGPGRAAHEFFAAEREFYVARNDAARWQYGRQQELGIGWANHDHHTYRSSREGFDALMQLWEIFGFEFRERYWAGDEAGWGAQIAEHPLSRVVTFSDVDLAPSERDIDFASQPLSTRASLGTIGLWCGLHGSSITAAGMHHLECEFDFERARANLTKAGFGVMAPFTDLPMLRQAFTVAQIWPVERRRVQALLAQASITKEQVERFLSAGAAGSHLEILQRWDGFKGFNKTGVSAIIRETDARRPTPASPPLPIREGQEKKGLMQRLPGSES